MVIRQTNYNELDIAKQNKPIINILYYCAFMTTFNSGFVSCSEKCKGRNNEKCQEEMSTSQQSYK